MIATAALEALGTGITVAVTDPRALLQAVAIVEHELACVDHACSRFRPDSELTHLNRNAGQWVRVGPLLMAALEVAIRAGQVTDGLVVPTIGRALISAGYDGDFGRLAKKAGAIAIEASPSVGFEQIKLDRQSGRAWIPGEVSLDLGSTAKALAADRAAAAVADITGASALVSCGGDLATAGLPPEAAWVVQVCQHHADPVGSGGETVTINQGGLATSGTVTRRWRRGDRELHHIIDPRTGLPAQTPWKLATVAAASCVDANIASTAAIVMGEGADAWLEEQGLASRLVRNDGTVVRTGGWPA